MTAEMRENRVKFSESFLEEIKNRLPVSQVVGASVQLKKHGREFQGLCPFHNEKTPSFTINDDKQFYHCFGCGAHGSVFSFLMEHDGLSFPEAVERLAGLAGLPMPKPDPQSQAREQKQDLHHQILEHAAMYFQAHLRQDAGRDSGRHAQDYLRQRGFGRNEALAFRLGYAPDERHGLLQALTQKGFEERQLLDVGLVIRPDQGSCYDRFRGRLMFPITDLKDRVVGFGGRLLVKKDKAPKYLNSPETPVFHKGRLLYNLANARRAVVQLPSLPTQPPPIIVTEGYTDVMALHQAGFKNAVAPMGTALTADQIRLLWTYADQIMLCFDGDEAGQRAAAKTIETLLPLLQPGKEARFITLPDGEDPDSLIRTAGQAAFAKLLSAATPLFDRLYDLERGSARLETPEARAGFNARLEARIAQIEHSGVQRAYRNALFEKNRNQRQQSYRKDYKKNKGARGGPHQAIQDGGEGARLPSAEKHRVHQALCLAVINHPAMLEGIFEEFGAFAFADSTLTQAQKILVDQVAGGEIPDSADNAWRHLSDQLGRSLLEKAFPKILYTLYPQVSRETPMTDVVTWWQAVSLSIQEKSSALTQSSAVGVSDAEDFEDWWEKRAKDLAANPNPF